MSRFINKKMDLNDKEIKRLIVIGLVIILAVLVFFLLKPIIFTILGGIILAYIFLPVHKKINSLLKIEWLSALIVTIIVALLLIVPLWFLVPLMTQQVFQMFLSLQNLDVSTLIISIFPTASEQFVAQTTIAFQSFISRSASGALTYLVDLFLSFPIILLHSFLLAFVFFFSLRDRVKIKTFLSEVSPFNHSQNRLLYNQFKNITDSVLYGQVVVGILQGLIAGLGLLLFGIPNALVLTIFAVILGIIPVIGPGFVWIPVTIYLFATGQTVPAIGYLAFNAIIVSSIDNVLRAYIISRRSDISAIVLFVGMIGGLFMFGILGVILGPLILTYLITLIKAYREKTLGSIFKEK